MVKVNLESNLVAHARRELELLGCDPEDIGYMIKIVQAFADVSPSGGQSAWMIGVLLKLLCYENLTDLTNDPSEWTEIEPNLIWQSCRRADAFSHDGGKHYYLLSQGANQDNPKPLHTSTTKR